MGGEKFTKRSGVKYFLGKTMIHYSHRTYKDPVSRIIRKFESDLHSLMLYGREFPMEAPLYMKHVFMSLYTYDTRIR